METYTQSFPIQFAPKADDAAVVFEPHVRFSILTSRLIRLEYSPSENFEDRPSQAFWYRKQAVPEYEVRRNNGVTEIETDYLLLKYRQSEGKFTADSLAILLKESGEKWHYGQSDPLNLKGTGRTLDNVDGRLELEDGLISRSGWSLWDDSRKLVFNDEGWIVARPGEEGYQDLYFFGYGQDYGGCLQDFCRVCGPAPMVPRWALGNWWSRYWAYSADELLALMDDFKAHDIPLSVCIVDMDWHLVDTGNECSGWTGYTWNRELFPDPPAFIRALHERGLKTALNLHPAEGIHGHEAQYELMAKALGIDPESQTPIAFAIDDPQFTRAYFEHLHHPYEEEGIDFWWLDWQQGTVSGLPGLDPLYWLNHLHFYDLARNGDKEPFIFSRWGGLGNHRYPIGFSGDTWVTWDSLAFQPYFTATAANVNYGWWSHDIGGHMSGVEDPELYARWVQFGVFSPIFRMHSTKNLYHERRPWGFDAETERVAANALRLRHRLIPYLQAMSWQNHKNSIPLIRPMYHEYPHDEQAYHCRDQYLFGTELLAAPFTSPAEDDTRLSRQAVWLPAGSWFDFFSGERVEGDGWQAIYGELEDIPVFAKAGAIVPLASSDNDSRKIALQVFPGAEGRAELFFGSGADSGALIPVSQKMENGQLMLTIDRAQILGSYTSEPSEFEIHIRGIDPAVSVQAFLDDQEIKVEGQFDAAANSMQLAPFTLNPETRLVITMDMGASEADDRRSLRIGYKLLKAFKMNTNMKQHLTNELANLLKDPSLLARYQFALTSSQMRALAELITVAGIHRADPFDGQSEEIILWNNQLEEGVQWYLAADSMSGIAQQVSGTLPKFGLLKVGDKGIVYHEGNLPLQGRVTIKQWFDSVIEQISNDDVKYADLVIQFDIEGKMGVRQYLEIDGGSVKAGDGHHERPDVTIKTKDDAWLGLINGEITAEELFVNGNLEIGGNFELISNLVQVLSVSPPGVYLGDHWRCEVNYFEALRLAYGKS